MKHSIVALLMVPLALTSCGKASGIIQVLPKDGASVPGIESPLRSAPRADLSSASDAQSLLVVIGSDVFGSELFSISGQAKEALPQRISDTKDLEYRETVSAPGGTSVVAITKSLYGAESDVRLVQVESGGSFVLFRTGELALSELSVSPDAKLVAFSARKLAQGPNGSRVLVARVKDGSVLDLGPGIAPSFAADEKSLLFVRNSNTGSEIDKATIVNQDALSLGPVVKVLSDAGSIQWFKLSPEDRALLYGRSSGRDGQVMIAQSGGRAPVALSSGTSWNEATWSPAGGKILFWSDSPAGEFLQIYDLELGKLSSLVAVHAETSGSVCPTWSPDGNAVFYSSKSGNWSRIYRFDLRSARQNVLTNPNFPGSYFCPRLVERKREAL